ncbi:MAG: 1-(5-phosphoribosyl)-5-[(5-phosphoribosylamino)methylideneamino] imidazole-4-carboxamide isomerase [bacterium]
MIATPAIDLRDGACVQLVGGSYADERVRLPDVLAVAREWTALGFRQLHVVDLDAAIGSGSNARVVDEILRDSPGRVQVGGGIRSGDRINELLAAGATRVVLGTKALEEPEWLAEQAARFPTVIVVAADVRSGRVVARGWQDTLNMTVTGALATLSGLPLAGVLVTAVDVEGQMRGPELALIDDVMRVSTHPVIASGGVTTLDDLRALAERGVAEAIIGMALYTGTLNARAVAQEFAE